MSIVMELGGKSLNNYFEQNNLLINNSVELRESNKREEVLTNIFICSAKALKQFHEFGVHNDIKADNFVIPHQSITDPLTTCKLIDLNLSKIRGQLNITGEYIQGCLLENPNHRPSMRAIVNFLEKICHRFSYELQNSVGNLCED
uniref:Protein kinase domain-containing protein n=1 Tax=Meloidogyne hapla TaxID=6305 RepID=A0A1I8AX22_MELHA